MNGSRYYGVRVEGAKFGIGFGSALAITISYSENHSILWAIIDGILSWLYVAFSRMTPTLKLSLIGKRQSSKTSAIHHSPWSTRRISDGY
jgi:hypothetical protein